MNPYQVIGLIIVCTSVFVSVVAGLTYLGVPLFAAFIGVYLATIWMMISMQKRAQHAGNLSGYSDHRNSGQNSRPNRRRSVGYHATSSANDDFVKTDLVVTNNDFAKS